MLKLHSIIDFLGTVGTYATGLSMIKIGVLSYVLQNTSAPRAEIIANLSQLMPDLITKC